MVMVLIFNDVKAYFNNVNKSLFIMEMEIYKISDMLLFVVGSVKIIFEVDDHMQYYC